MKILLIVNPQRAASQTLAHEIKVALERAGALVRVYAYTDKEAPCEAFDLAVSLGGDGTVLFAARTVAAQNIPVLPVNLGTLGFIASIRPEEWQTVFANWREGSAFVSERVMLNVQVERQCKKVVELSALNDAVISASGIAKTIRLNAATEHTHLAAYRSDGLIAATPTGSTAYSASAGGPILDPEMEAIILNPVCPFLLFQRPLVVPADETIIINIEQEQRSGVLLTIDGQVTEALESGDRVLVRKASAKAKIIVADRGGFYSSIHSKLDVTCR